MDSILISLGFSSSDAIRQRAITYFWAITSIVVSNLSSVSVSYSPTKSNTHRISSCCEAIMNRLQLTKCMASTMNVKGSYDIGKRRYNVKIWKIFTECFNTMPIVALIDDKIICMHGGLSPDLKNIKKILTIARPTDIPEAGLLCDLLWSDPAKDIQGWT